MVNDFKKEFDTRDWLIFILGMMTQVILILSLKLFGVI